MELVCAIVMWAAFIGIVTIKLYEQWRENRA